MGVERVPITDAFSAMSQLDRRVRGQERRLSITTPADLLGPGFGATATEVLDWDDEVPTFTGQFWCPVGALNSPDPSKEWVGFTISQDERAAGVQKLWSLDDDPLISATRRFTRSGDAFTYTPWRGATGWVQGGATGIVAVSGATILNSEYKVAYDGISVALVVQFTLGSTLTADADGNFADTTVAQLPAAITPSGSTLVQPLGNVTAGTAGVCYVTPTGGLVLASAAPGRSITSANVNYIGGTYFL